MLGSWFKFDDKIRIESNGQISVIIYKDDVYLANPHDLYNLLRSMDIVGCEFVLKWDAIIKYWCLMRCDITYSSKPEKKSDTDIGIDRNINTTKDIINTMKLLVLMYKEAKQLYDAQSKTLTLNEVKSLMR